MTFLDWTLLAFALYLLWGLISTRMSLAELERRHKQLVELSVATSQSLDTHLALLKNHERRITDGEQGARFWVDKDGAVRRACE